MLVTTIERNPFLGRILTGRIAAGSVKANDPIHTLNREGKEVEKGRVSKVLAFRGLERTPIEVGVRRATSSPLPGSRPRPSPTRSAPPRSPRPLRAPHRFPDPVGHLRINDGPLAGREATRCSRASSATA